MSIIDTVLSKQDLKKFSLEKKKGYKLEDKEEFGIVRDTLVNCGMPIENFDNNLTSLIVNEVYSKNIIYEQVDFTAGNYNYKSNKINLLEKREDFIHELFHMASNDLSNTDILYGCKIKLDKENIGDALNEGITDYFTSLAVKDYKPRYPIEAFFASYIAKIYGMDIFKEYFNGNPKNFYSCFGEDKEYIKEFVESLDDFHNRIASYYEYKESHSSKESEYIDMFNDLFYAKKKGNDISDSFMNCISDFLKLLRVNDFDKNEFVGDLSKMLTTNGNEVLSVVNLFFQYSSYMGVENIIKGIKEIIDEESNSLC